MEMGAKYKPDWDKSCSHLVCAFMNTPKFNQVKGRGKIVTRQWIEECHSQRKKLPWRRYALDKYEKDKDESEEEVWEQIKEAPKSPILQKDNNERNDNDDDDIMEQASDTEDIIEQIKNSNTTPLKNGAHNSPVKEILGSSGLKNEDPYSAETDTDEETSKRIKQIKHKPFDFFKDKFFC
ncbi:hypothetical protein HHI36_024196 [Cryptolaemus montrouzieri]|uniref:BRCT domain-containing protein n=1 Tax=Cryptolaemus montrouzieri TaxID=559131 RepID=A0ABD2NC26_9CUCU